MRAFIPPPLPPEPPVDFGPLQRLLDGANQAIGRLDGIASALPDISLFLYTYVRKEALLSSQIEGTQSSLSDLLLYEANGAPGVPVGDVREVVRYVAAMEYGLRRLRESFPLSLRLLREIHAELLSTGRGDDKQPGEFRTSQNWIGGSRPGNAVFVPPPPGEVMPCMGQLEAFIHADTPHIPLLVKAALVHVQFETVHPFLDGNGRIGRLLIGLMLCEQGVLQQPLLYLSLFLKRHRTRYYGLLQVVREQGDWEGWIAFFLEGVTEVAGQATDALRRLVALFRDDQARIESLSGSGRSTLRLHLLLQRTPMVSIGGAAEALGLSQPTVTQALERLTALGIVTEATGRQRGRIFTYAAHLAILSDGTEPLPR